MSSEVTAIASTVEQILSELEEDYVGLWVIPWLIRRELVAPSDESVFRCAEAVLREVTAHGALMGDLSGTTGQFAAWPASSAVDAALAAWQKLARDPDIGEVCWLAAPSEVEAADN